MSVCDREQDGAGRRQAAQGLALAAQPPPVAGTSSSATRRVELAVAVERGGCGATSPGRAAGGRGSGRPAPPGSPAPGRAPRRAAGRACRAGASATGTARRRRRAATPARARGGRGRRAATRASAASPSGATSATTASLPGSCCTHDGSSVEDVGAAAPSTLGLAVAGATARSSAAARPIDGHGPRISSTASSSPSMTDWATSASDRAACPSPSSGRSGTPRPRPCRACP